MTVSERTLTWRLPGKAFPTIRESTAAGGWTRISSSPPSQDGKTPLAVTYLFTRLTLPLCVSRAQILSSPSIFNSSASSTGHTPTPGTLETDMTTPRHPLEGHNVQSPAELITCKDKATGGK